jgi:hypothetical protein
MKYTNKWMVVPYKEEIQQTTPTNLTNNIDDKINSKLNNKKINNDEKVQLYNHLISQKYNKESLPNLEIKKETFKSKEPTKLEESNSVGPIQDSLNDVYDDEMEYDEDTNSNLLSALNKSINMLIKNNPKKFRNINNTSTIVDLENVLNDMDYNSQDKVALNKLEKAKSNKDILKLNRSLKKLINNNPNQLRDLLNSSQYSKPPAFSTRNNLLKKKKKKKRIEIEESPKIDKTNLNRNRTLSRIQNSPSSLQNINKYRFDQQYIDSPNYNFIKNTAQIGQGGLVWKVFK